MSEQQVAIVTGSSKGIGYAVARELGSRGMAVVVNARSGDELRSAEERLRAEGVDVVGVVGSVADDEVTARLADVAVAELGRVDHVVNVVAVNPFYGSLLDVPRAAFEKTVLVNTWSAISVVREAVRAGLGSHPGASVVNVSTIGARQYQPGLAAYCASKSALETVSLHLAQELGPRGIRVNTVAPGLTKTDMAAVLWEGEYGEFEKSVLPLGRLGEPEDIARAVAFLTSDQSSWMTGAYLNVDGGRLTTSLTHSPESVQ